MMTIERDAHWAFLAGSIALALLGCTKTEHHSVSWYEEHKQDLEAKVTWCADDRSRQSDVDCQNAVQAKTLTSVGDFDTRRQAPVSFGPPASSETSTTPK
jgi:hypothetical protein